MNYICLPSDAQMDAHAKDTDIFSAIETLKEETRMGHEKEDVSHYFGDAKKKLFGLAKSLKKELPSSRMEASFKDIQALYHELMEEERWVALEKFKRNGGEENDFEMRPVPLDIAFQELLKTLNGIVTMWRRERRVEHSNALAEKKKLLNKLRLLIDGRDIQSNFAAFEEIQREWRKTGDSAGPQSNTLWANYHALINRFYNQKSIYFELKELDRKKNLEKKTALCEKAEKLLDKDNIKDAIEQLKAIHYEFKTTGPVPARDTAAIWLRLKAASDALHAKLETYLKAFRKTLNENKRHKEKLVEEVAQFEQFLSDHPTEWHRRTKDIMALKKKWEQAGAVPRPVAGKLSRDFWSVYKHFFSNRRKFFKKWDERRMGNLKEKKELLKLALELKDSSDWEYAAEALKKLQRTWKTIGPVPEQYAYKIADDFRCASDFFFARQRGQLEEQQATRFKNFDKKMASCEEIEKMSAAGPTSLTQLTDWMERYNTIGLVPDDKADELENRFKRALDTFFETLTGLDEDKKRLKLFELQQRGLKDDPQRERKLRRTEQAIRKKIREGERDIAVFQNNLDFFGRSQRAEKMKGELTKNLTTSLARLAVLKTQLKLLQSVL